LIFFLAWRDIKIRYKQTFIGIFWIILQPFLTMIILNIVFGEMTKTVSNIPYPLLTYTGLIYWNLFSKSVTSATECLSANRDIITKVYLPKLILPIASVFVNIVDFFISLVMLILLLIYYRYSFNPAGIVIMPIILFLTVLISIGIGSAFSALNLIYRDIKFIIPFFLQILLLITPILYPINFVPSKYRAIFDFNPLTRLIEVSRNSLLINTFNIDIPGLLLIGLYSIIFFVVGIYIFIKLEKYFSDIV